MAKSKLFFKTKKGMIKPIQYETIVKEVTDSVAPDDYNKIFGKFFLNTEDRRSPLIFIQALFLM